MVALKKVIYNATSSLDLTGKLTLRVSGTMSTGLTFIYLLSDKNLVPTTLFFFNNNKWNDDSYGKLAFKRITNVVSALITYTLINFQSPLTPPTHHRLSVMRQATETSLWSAISIDGCPGYVLFRRYMCRYFYSFLTVVFTF